MLVSVQEIYFWKLSHIKFLEETHLAILDPFGTNAQEPCIVDS